jgi:hypothetical protein
MQWGSGSIPDCIKYFYLEFAITIEIMWDLKKGNNS